MAIPDHKGENVILQSFVFKSHMFGVFNDFFHVHGPNEFSEKRETKYQH